MEFELSVAEENKYILIKINGPMTVELGGRSAAEADALGKKMGIDRYLTDLRGCPNEDRATRNYEFATRDMAEMGLSRTARSALLTDPGDRSHDFVLKLMDNTGYNVRLFDDEQACLDWLLE